MAKLEDTLSRFFGDCGFDYNCFSIFVVMYRLFG